MFAEVNGGDRRMKWNINLKNRIINKSIQMIIQKKIIEFKDGEIKIKLILTVNKKNDVLSANNAHINMIISIGFM